MSRKRPGETAEVGGDVPARPTVVGNQGEGSCRAGGVAREPAAPQAERPDEEAGEGLEQPATQPEAEAGRCQPDKGGLVHLKRLPRGGGSE
jgi:hypothetical protein